MILIVLLSSDEPQKYLFIHENIPNSPLNLLIRILLFINNSQ